MFFFNDTATTEIYTLSLHDALPICARPEHRCDGAAGRVLVRRPGRETVQFGVGGARHRPVLLRTRIGRSGDRKSTRLNSSHANISYAVFCLKKQTPSPFR